MASMIHLTAVVIVALATGCATVESNTSGAGSSGGAGAGSGVSTGAGGAGGAGGTGGAGGAPGAPACSDPTVFFDMIGDGLMLHFTASCGPTGRVVIDGSVPPSSTVDIVNCTMDSGGHQIVLFAHAVQWPATVNNASIRYFRDASSWGGSDTVNISSFGPLGGVIEGDYTGDLVRDFGSAPPDQIMVSGKFRVCHGPDEPGGK